MIHGPFWLALPALAGALYFTLALAASLRRPPRPDQTFTPPLSILKPIHGRDANLYEALLSHAVQDYPDFEILFGVADPKDPALEDIHRIVAEFPNLSIRIVTDIVDAPNGKTAALIALAAAARHSILVVNDSDILVERDYLRQVAAPLANPGTGLVTCMYRARGSSPATRFEALGIASEFMASVMVARLIGVAEFALGSTMAFRREHLRQIGGFESMANYLADDYQLGARIHALGLHIAFAGAIVETGLGPGTWAGVWQHQLRWSRTIRVSRPGGYLGSIVTHATFWALVAALAGHWRIAYFTLAIRLLAAAATGKLLKTRIDLWLVPFRDLWGFAVWCGGLAGSTVVWRGRKLRLRSDGCLEPIE